MGGEGGRTYFTLISAQDDLRPQDEEETVP